MINADAMVGLTRQVRTDLNEFLANAQKEAGDGNCKNHNCHNDLIIVREPVRDWTKKEA